MWRTFFVGLSFLLLPSHASQLELQNDLVKATIDDTLGLVGLSEIGADGDNLNFAGDSWIVTVGGFRYTADRGTSTTTTTQWIVKMGYACHNSDGLVDRLTTDSIDECEDACKHSTKGCMEFSWKADGACRHYPSVQIPIRNVKYNCGYNVVPPTPAPERLCNATTVGITGPMTASLNYTCGAVNVQVSYSLRHGGAFVEKRLSVTSKNETIPFQGASLFDGIRVALNNGDAVGKASWRSQTNPFSGEDLQIAGFVGWPVAARGAFVSVANPWARFDAARTDDDSTLAVYAFYYGDYNHSTKLQGDWFQTEPGVIGFTSLTKYANEGVNTGERIAFQRCVENHHLDREARQNKTVKVMVAWDANDYQIDVGTEEGRTEYKRILDRNAEFGVTHVVYEPRNTLHSSRFNTTDGWGWEGSLWLSMGELIREGRWDPRTDEVPEDILGMIKYAGDRNIKFLSYAYPMLPFEEMRPYFVSNAPNALSLAPPQVQTYFIDIMTAFMKKTGIGGWAWDHNIFAGRTNKQKDELAYAQWRGWMNIVGTLRERFPDMVMDHRQTAHRWGPWYQLAGSYAEPIAGDENPESYGVPIASLHTDHVAADNTRRINYLYSTQDLLPPSRVPGFIFHQTERTDDDETKYCTKHTHLCVNNSNTRDFDLLGYKYSLLSTVGTAGLNNVLTMIPARDLAEFHLFPKEDVAFIQKWLAWTDAKIENLRNTQWIPTLKGPQIGHVDGTHSMLNDAGFVFLFNPNMDERRVRLAVDESLGITNSSRSSEWKVTELYPRDGVTVATWRHGETVEVSVGGSDARVLELSEASDATRSAARLIHASMSSAEVSSVTNDLDLTAVTGPSGQEVIITVRVDTVDSASHVSVNGLHCGMTSEVEVAVAVRFAGEPALRVMPVSPDKPPTDFTGGWFNTTFTIPNSVKQQLEERAAKYPIPWTYDNTTCGLSHCVDDSKATWLIPSRLLLNPFIASPKDDMVIDLFINGESAALQKSYNSRGRSVSKCYLGFYYDASHIEQNTTHELAIHLPPMEEGSFHGLFWENVVTKYTDEVSSCRLVTDSRASAFYV